MPDTQYFTNIDGKYCKDSDARIQISDIADFVGYLSYLDGVTYNINGASPVLEKGRFWTKWNKSNGIRPIDNAGNYIKVDWTQDWEIGVAILIRNAIVWEGATCAFGEAVSNNYWAEAPTLLICAPNFRDQPTHHFALRKNDATHDETYTAQADTGFSEGTDPDAWYFVKASYKADTHTYSISATKDFVNWVSNSASYANVIPSTSSNDYIGFGASNNNILPTPIMQNIILDLANTYIKQNGVMIWGHYDGAFAGENHYVNPAMPWRPLEDGYSNFWFELTDDTLSPWLNFSNKNADATIDWGDGSGEVALDTLTPTHTYVKAGRYVVKVKGVTGIAQQQSTPYQSDYLRILKYVELNNQCTSLGNYAFMMNLGLKQFIGGSVTSVGGSAFTYCPSLEVLKLSNITTLGNSNARYCESLKEIAIGNITIIGTNTIQYCIGIEEITIPSTVTNISASSINTCYTLSKIHILSTEPPTLSINNFVNLASDFIIYVPTGTAETYKSASGWSTYADHILEEGQTPNRMMLAKLGSAGPGKEETDEPQDDMR